MNAISDTLQRPAPPASDHNGDPIPLAIGISSRPKFVRGQYVRIIGSQVALTVHEWETVTHQATGSLVRVYTLAGAPAIGLDSRWEEWLLEAIQPPEEIDRLRLLVYRILALIT
jgi:hypothetical protein